MKVGNILSNQGGKGRLMLDNVIGKNFGKRDVLHSCQENSVYGFLVPCIILQIVGIGGQPSFMMILIV